MTCAVRAWQPSGNTVRFLIGLHMWYAAAAAYPRKPQLLEVGRLPLAAGPL